MKRFHPVAVVRAVPAQDASLYKRAELILNGNQCIPLTMSDARKLLESLEVAIEQMEIA